MEVIQTIDLQPVRTSLADLENEVDSGLALVREGANRMKQALYRIRKDRLWATVEDAFGKSVYPSFDDYLKIRWSLSKSYGHEMAAAGETITEMLESGIPEEQIPTEATRLRELKKTDPEDRGAVLQAAQQITGGEPTAGAIAQARKIVKPEPGQQYEVIEPSNPHHGKVITANEVKGGVVVGLEIPQPFMPAELQPVDPTPEPPNKPKPSRTQALQGLLIEVLERCDVPADLESRIRDALT